MANEKAPETPTHVLLTRIVFDDAIEGQIIKVGTREACENLMHHMPAVAIKDDRPIVRSDLMCLRLDMFSTPPEPGQIYRFERQPEDTECDTSTTS